MSGSYVHVEEVAMYLSNFKEELEGNEHKIYTQIGGPHITENVYGGAGFDRPTYKFRSK